MKKVLFCAAFVAALSMAFVACGKKDNKAAEGEEAGLVLDNEDADDVEEAAPCAEPKADCCDLHALVDKFCAACDADDEAAVTKYGMELQKYADELANEQELAMRVAAAGQAFAERHGYIE